MRVETGLRSWQASQLGGMALEAEPCVSHPAQGKTEAVKEEKGREEGPECRVLLALRKANAVPEPNNNWPDTLRLQPTIQSTRLTARHFRQGSE